MDKKIVDSDKKIIRDVALKQLFYANSKQMQQLKKEWYRHNECKAGRPMVTVEMGTFYNDVIPPLLQCQGELARSIESDIYCNFVNHALFDDDVIVPDYIGVDIPTYFTPFGINIAIDHASDPNSLGHHFVEVIKDLGNDFHLLKKSTYGVNRQKGEETKAFLEDLLGDIIPVRYKGRCLYSVPTQHIVHIMSMENMLFSFYDYPDEFKAMMNMLVTDYDEYYRFLEKEQLILPTTASEPVAQGTFAFTNELPGFDELAKRPFTTKDVWGFMDSQETTGISLDIYKEFIFPYYKRISDNYGLLSYGCCEPVDPFWECISTLENLRKVSISPWCNEEYMGEQLAGKKIIYQRKPSPNYLGVGSQLDEESLRAHIKKTVTASNGCTLEFTQRDVYQLGNSFEKVKRYVEIIREEYSR
ncbi:MAG: hypothetical protein RR444_05370 [Oscillospiraceae bacterium]